MKQFRFIIIIVCLSAVMSFISIAHAGPVDPSSYLCFDSSLISGCDGKDSPFKSIDFSGGYFYLENFEDVALNTPGVTGDGEFFAFGPQRDSVDEDDGVIDGDNYIPGPPVSYAWAYSNGDAYSSPQSITFDFDETVLGMLPTHVGVVWTDGFGNTTFTAYDGLGDSLGSIGPVTLYDELTLSGETAEDTFLGWINMGGISKITISDDFAGLEVDHLQYGVAPEPVSSILFIVGGATLGFRRWRKKFKR